MGIKTILKQAALALASIVLMPWGYDCFQEGKGACVGGGVAETTHGTLEESGPYSPVESSDPPLAVQSFEGLGGGCTVPVLVIHGGPHPLENW